MKEAKIKISRNGPYVVTGNVPLSEMIIGKRDKDYVYVEGRTFKTNETYYLCRCGKTKTSPFCDGTHACINFDGELTAKRCYKDSDARTYEGKNLLLKDYEELCAFARFCHSSIGDVWTVTEDAENKTEEEMAVKMATECPAGRLVIYDRESNTPIEPVFEPSIVILQDPLRECSGPIWVRGGIPIVDEKDNPFEVRNRVTLCRCGESHNKPFCDSRHVTSSFKDDYFKVKK